MNRPSYSSRLAPAKIFILFLLVVSQSLAFQNPPDKGCFVYPSPARGNSAWVVFNIPESGIARVFVFNEAGDLMARQEELETAGNQQIQLDLTHYRRGFYICRVVLALDSGLSQSLKVFKFSVAK